MHMLQMLHAGWGPVKYRLDQVSPEPAARVRQALTAALQAFAEPGAVRLRGTAWLVTAVAPAL